MEDQSERIETLRTELLLLLDNIDYDAGNCRASEPIGAILPLEILLKVRKAAKAQTPDVEFVPYPFTVFQCGTGEMGTLYWTPCSKCGKNHLSGESCIVNSNIGRETE